MKGINLKRFVDINIKTHEKSTANGTRESVFLCVDGTALTVGTVYLIKSYEEALNYFGENSPKKASLPNVIKYLKIYFEHGGISALVMGTGSHASLNMIPETVYNDYICASSLEVVDCSTDSSEIIEIPVNIVCIAAVGYSYADMKRSAQNYQSGAVGIDKKLFITYSNEYSDNEPISSLVVKYSSYAGSEMTIAAYLSTINCYEINSIRDYMYTQEKEVYSDAGIKIFGPSIISDSQYGTIIDNNYNVDIALSNSVRNCGGNCKDGSDLVNSYVNIILHQTLTDRLISLLTEKIKNSEGISKIYTTLCSELENYVSSGYLTTDKIWKDSDLNITVSGKTYNIIRQGTPLLLGYKVVVLPLSSLTDEQKEKRSAPYIYIVIAEQYGIRVITVNGEII